MCTLCIRHSSLHVFYIQIYSFLALFSYTNVIIYSSSRAIPHFAVLPASLKCRPHSDGSIPQFTPYKSYAYTKAPHQ